MNPTMTDLFDNYLNNQLSDKEKSEFELKINTNQQFKEDFENYKLLTLSLNEYFEKSEITKDFEKWHTEISENESKKVRVLWFRITSVAAGVAIFISLSSIWFYNTFKTESKNQTKEITLLKKEIKQIQNQHNSLIRSFQKIQKKTYAPANFQSTGFAIYGKYLITTWHSIQNADSIFVENDFQSRTEAKPVYVNKNIDLALLYVPSFQNKKSNLHLYNKQSNIGNTIFTLGFPSAQLVYNEGYISAINGYNSDTAYYQITLPLNPGNSGGPIFDNKGRLIGVIVSKNITMEGVAFALKSSMICALRDSLPADSLKIIWDKSFKNRSPLNAEKQAFIEQYKPNIYNIYVYHKEK